MRIDEIQQQVGRGDYHVDNLAVADAILRRLMAGQPRRPATDEISPGE